MNPRSLIYHMAEIFRASGIPDPEYDSSVLLSHLCGISPLALRLDAETVLDDEIQNRFRFLCEQRISRKPLQYILQEAPFLGKLFYVDHRVLIPRPETELLCEWALEILSAKDQARVLDLCCGSGCIGIMLKLLAPSALVTETDISPDALDVAKYNASRLQADVRLVQGDLFSGVPGSTFDLVVTNPPYIPSSECETLQAEVIYEPRIALDGGSDGLDIYRRICEETPWHLSSGGALLMELGDGEAEKVASLMQSAGFSSVTVRNDYQSLPRMICGVLI